MPGSNLRPADYETAVQESGSLEIEMRTNKGVVKKEQVRPIALTPTQKSGVSSFRRAALRSLPPIGPFHLIERLRRTIADDFSCAPSLDVLFLFLPISIPLWTGIAARGAFAFCALTIEYVVGQSLPKLRCVSGGASDLFVCRFERRVTSKRSVTCCGFVAARMAQLRQCYAVAFCEGGVVFSRKRGQ